MKYLVFSLVVLMIDPPGKIGKVNAVKSEAKDHYERGEYKQAAEQYRTLTDSLGVKEDEVSMNLAHSYFQLNDTTNAQNNYLPLTNSSNAKFRSVANQQLGVMANRTGKIEEALNYFKNALKADPSNDEARYNYEMVKKKLEEKKKQEEKQKQQNKDQKKDDKKNDEKKEEKENKDNKDEKGKGNQQEKDKKDQEKKDKEQQDKDQKDKEEQQKKNQEQQDKDNKDKKDSKELPPSVSDKLKEMKISEEKARMVLEAMKNQEVQYLQQNKRKATKPKSKGKPDW
jgi:Ca-activated chloride channel family protein